MVLTSDDVKDGLVPISRVQAEASMLIGILEENIKKIDVQSLEPKDRLQKLVWNKMGRELAEKQKELLKYLQDGIKETFLDLKKTTEV